MAYDDNTIDVELTETVSDSYNDETNNTTNANLTVTDALNTDNSVNDSGNVNATATDSFHEDSHNSEFDIDDSGNTDSYNTVVDASDNSVDDHSDNSVNDDSINVGNRTYSTGFEGAAGGAAAAGGGNATIVDQSLNSNVSAGGSVFQNVASEAVVASGENSMAAGDDIDVEMNVDQSTNMTAGGDINIGNETTVTTTIDSHNTYTDNSSWSDSSTEVHWDNVGNDYSQSYSATDSFNETDLFSSTSEYNIDVDAIVDSHGAVIGDVDIAL